MTKRTKFQAAFDGMVEHLAVYVPELLDAGDSVASVRETLADLGDDARSQEIGVDLTLISREDMQDVIDVVFEKLGVV